MTTTSTLRGVNGAIDRWLTASPVAHAPQSLGIFRIVYALFYLWHLSFQRAELLAGLPANSRGRVVLVNWFPFDAPPIAFQAIESVLVASIVLLLFGWRTRLMTAAVFSAGALLEGLFSVGDKENGAVFLTFFIPFFMLLARCPWGEAYSLDAARRRHLHPAAHLDSAELSARCALPVRATLVILSALFVSAGMSKVFGSGIWLRDFTVMSNFALYHNVEAALLGLRPNPWAPQINAYSFIHIPMQFGVLLFETTFFVAWFDRRLLRLYVGLALVFQAINGLLFVVTFAPLLIAYGPFIDWEAIRRRVAPRARVSDVNPTTGALVAWFAAILLAATWNLGALARSVFSLGGLVDWRGICWPILPAGVWLVVSAMWQIGRALTVRARSAPITSQVAASR